MFHLTAHVIFSLLNVPLLGGHGWVTVREGHSVSNRAKIEEAPEEYFVTHGARGAGGGSDRSAVEPVATDPGMLPNRRRRFWGNVGRSKVYPTSSKKRRLLR